MRRTPPTEDPVLFDRGIAAVLAGTALALVGLCLLSLRWRIFHDAALMEYVASSIRSGARPYADTFDMNFPGTYLFHVIGQSLLGPSDLAFRVRDLALLGVGSAVVHRYLRPVDRTAAAVAVMLVVWWYMAIGRQGMALQRDWIIALCVLAAVALVTETGTTWRVVGAGLLLGVAVTIKPTALLAVPLVLVIASGSEERDPAGADSPRPRRSRRVAVTAAQLTAGTAIVCGIAVVWLVWSGGWASFTWLIENYLPLYARLDGSGHELGSTPHALWWAAAQTASRPELPAYVAGIAVICVRRRPTAALRRVGGLVALAAIGIVYGVVGVKTWTYHFSLWYIAAYMVLAAGFGDLRSRRWATWLPAHRRWISASVSAALLVCCALPILRREPVHVLALTFAPLVPVVALAVIDLVRWVRARTTTPVRASGRAVGAFTLLCFAASSALLGFGVASAAFPRSDGYGDSFERIDAITDVIRRETTADQGVLVLDTSGGAVNALMRADRRRATRFMYDFHFFHDVDDPAIGRLRRELMTQLRNDPPQLVVAYRTSWSNRTTIESLNAFPELDRFLADYRGIYQDSQAVVLERSGAT